MIKIKSPQFRELASWLAPEDYILTITFEPESQAVIFKTHHRDKFFDRLNELVLNSDLDLEEITSPDDNLQAVFDYLVEK
jgi:ABC-2 type transport system ATP-binding protein